MSRQIDWNNLLLPGMRGLAVEGKTDKTIIEAFLTAGENAGKWSNWRGQLRIEVTEKSEHVLAELKRAEFQGRVWGLIDRDWRRDDEVQQMQAEYPFLLILPRITIENYCVHPDELARLLPAAQQHKIPQLKALIESQLDRWIQHGALSQILYERGANDFCRGVSGYPNALLGKAGLSDAEIRHTLDTFCEQLNADRVLKAHHQRLIEFRQNGENIYYHCINGKEFFNQVVVNLALRQVFYQQSADRWLDDLFLNPPDCPDDLTPLLRQVVVV